MKEVCVTHDFNFDIEKVFAGISDHVAFLSTSTIRCRMLRSGETDPNGLGALREVRKGSILFEETINVFDPPHAYEYRILSLRGPFKLKLPFHHELGRLELHGVERKTRLVWVSRFRFAVPLIGGWIERRLANSIGASFAFFLSRLDARLQRSSGSA
ncbi:MAG: SRPBCC family protein [Arenimonas sp.]